MGWQEIIALLVAASCALFAARSVYSILTGKSGCSKRCHCATKNTQPMKVKSFSDKS